MKSKKTVACFVPILGVLLVISSCATTMIPLPTDNIDELLGTWINPAYDNISKGRAKNVFKEDGTIARYRLTKDGNPRNVHYIDVKEKWIDRKGDVYFKVLVDTQGEFFNALLKIDSNRNTLEVLEAARIEILPSEMNPDAPYCIYYIFYRQ